MPSFADVAKGSGHSIGVTADGRAFSWGTSSSLGQLGRSDDYTPAREPAEIPLPDDVVVKRAYVSDSEKDSGHSAIVDTKGRLWMAGCDRWQQLGLGSPNAGSAGYTWIGGKLWQERFVRSPFVEEIMKQENPTSTIRDVSLGADHTLVLSSNGRDVYGFGKGGDGQLGFVGKPFVSAPKKSKVLSQPGTAAVCAIQHCSLTLGHKGEVKQKVGRRCNSDEVRKGLKRCIKRAQRHGLTQA
ncbi:MAG: hypothetical protein SGARI_000307 [Bacillariaceae sp.]